MPGAIQTGGAKFLQAAGTQMPVSGALSSPWGYRGPGGSTAAIQVLRLVLSFVYIWSSGVKVSQMWFRKGESIYAMRLVVPWVLLLKLLQR
jgi:hypothetical protein